VVRGRSRAGRPPGRSGTVTKRRIVTAALKTLKDDGFAGASARVIARRGRFNPALIFYHFGGVTDLLLAALDETSRARMSRYRELVERVDTLPEAVDAAAQLYREDMRSGHITVLAEMIAGASSLPELGPEIVARIEPWIRMTEETISRVVAGTPLEQLASPDQVAFAIVALYLGMEMLTHLEGDAAPAEGLFKLAADLSAMLTALFPEEGGPA
jgi:AcrR family transcriptional regulator